MKGKYENVRYSLKKNNKTVMTNSMLMCNQNKNIVTYQVKAAKVHIVPLKDCCHIFDKNK